jgi:S-adenosylhomocysteine hydrolase
LNLRIADLHIAEFGCKGIRLADYEMPGLLAGREALAEPGPLNGGRITGSLHETVQAAVQIATRMSLGVKLTALTDARSAYVGVAVSGPYTATTTTTHGPCNHD